MKIIAINEESLLIKFSDDITEETHLKVRAYYDILGHKEGILSRVPSYNSLLITYDIIIYSLKEISDFIEAIQLDNQNDTSKKRILKLPVCYKLGLDLERVSEYTGLSHEEIIEIHTGRDYLIYMIGFTPGFPYLGGMDERLETPRLENPRTLVDAGSVGIGGKQTGVYPLNTPGGWNIIGRSPVDLFDKESSKTLLKMGDYIRFYPISQSEYEVILNDKNYKVEVEIC